MRTVPLSEARDNLSGLVDDVNTTHEIVTITRHGRPAAVLISADDLESLHETLYWLSQPGVGVDVDEARAVHARGESLTGADLRTRLGLPPR